MKFYAYGIVDSNDVPYFDESCICKHPEPLGCLVQDLNDTDDPHTPYRVVKLQFEEVR